MDGQAQASMRIAAVTLLFCALVLLCGCQVLAPNGSDLPAPKTTREFIFDPQHDEVVGELQVIRANAADTFPDIARRFNLGFEELVNANPDVDPWLPGEGTEILLPTRFVLPDAPRTGIVVNLAAMRLYYFPPAQAGTPRRVVTHPVGIGRIDWKTPEGQTRIVSKTEAPTWYPTRSIRREYAANGDPLPAVVPPGPDNPMGRHALRLGWPKYAIHGTNKPPSIGLRGTHGCLRLYPEDIARLYRDVPIGTVVRVVNQPTLFGWRGDDLYVQTYPVLGDDGRDQNLVTQTALSAAVASSAVRLEAGSEVRIDRALLAEMLQLRGAIALPITASDLDLPAYLAEVTRVRNPAALSEPSETGDERVSLTDAAVAGGAADRP